MPPGTPATTVTPFILILCLILVGTYALKGPFFALSSEWLAGTAAAAGLAGADLPIGGSGCCAETAGKKAIAVARVAAAIGVLDIMLTGSESPFSDLSCANR